MTLDMTKLEPLLGTMVNELGAAANAALVLTGDKLGLYRALAAGGPLTSAGLAAKTGTHERYIREWLASQAASGFVTYEAATESFWLSPEQAAVFADEESLFNMTGGFYSLSAVFTDEPKLTEAFKTGKGVGWSEHSNCLFCGVDRFFRPGYRAHLLAEWLPALDGVVEKLERGAKVADVGCGHGSSTLIMAKAFPNSQFVGIDFHGASIAHAREHVGDLDNPLRNGARPGLSPFGLRSRHHVRRLHDMVDPVGAAAHVRRTLKPDGTLMLVEPRAGDSLADNLNPVGRIFYAFSASVCVPSGLGQDVGEVLGGQAGDKRIGEVVRQGGFARFRRAAETPFNVVLEARP